MFIALCDESPFGAVWRSGNQLREYNPTSVPLLQTAQGLVSLESYRHVTPPE